LHDAITDIPEHFGRKVDELKNPSWTAACKNCVSGCSTHLVAIHIINVRFSATSTSILRVVDELPDVLRHNLTTGKSMRIVPLPALKEELPNEQDVTFLETFNLPLRQTE
jgi:hypothetical protein